MNIHLQFLGAAQSVTGSKHLLQVEDTHILVDCGLHQERTLQTRNWAPFPIAPSTITAVLLTHAHLDHCGYLPRLVKEGFRGKIYCTPATAELARLILLDAGFIQEEDAEYKRQRHEKEGRKGKYPEVPLYTAKDAEACSSLFSPIQYNECVRINRNIQACFYNAGHVLGSAMIQVRAQDGQKARTILFTGDIGRPNSPIIQDPDIFKEADYILLESTYGDKVHGALTSIHDQMSSAIRATYQKQGNIIIPSFALERAQEVLYYINELRLAKQIPEQPVLIDSPMASKITNVFERYPNLFDAETTELVQNGHSPFRLPRLRFIGSREESRNINKIQEPVIIIAGSGMCTGGRVKYHLLDNIQRAESTVMFVGYQAEGTLGRQILTGSPQVRIYGRMMPVHATITKIDGFSAHADREELLQWLRGFESNHKALFLVHGEEEIMQKFASFLEQNLHCPIHTPKYLDGFTLA